jgi:adenylate cyclase
MLGSIVGIQRYAHDIFDPAVNLAARMERLSDPIRITVSSETYDLIREEFNFKERSVQDVKRFSPMDLFYLEGEKECTAIRRETRI